MAGCKPPSFSLGLDLGLDWEPQIAPDKHPTQTPTPHDEDFRPEVMDSNPESRPKPPLILKRLRRDPTTTLTTKTSSPRALTMTLKISPQKTIFLKVIIKCHFSLCLCVLCWVCVCCFSIWLTRKIYCWICVCVSGFVIFGF